MKNNLMKALLVALTTGFVTAAWSGELIVVKPHAAKPEKGSESNGTYSSFFGWPFFAHLFPSGLSCN